MSDDSRDLPEADPGVPHALWYRFAAQLLTQLDRDHTFVVSASLAYFGFMALFPTLIAFVSLFGLIADPHWVQQQLETLSTLMPAAAAQLVREQLLQIVDQRQVTLSTSLVLSVLGSLWGASGGTVGLIKGLNIIYGIEEERGYLRMRVFAVSMALWVMLYGLVILCVLFGLPYLGRLVPGLRSLEGLFSSVRWVIVGAMLAGGLALVYRFAPCRQVTAWGWVTWGSVTGTAIWLVASLLFSLYVSRLGDFQATYGALASVVVLLLWLYISGLSVLIGAEVDSAVGKLARGEL